MHSYLTRIILLVATLLLFAREAYSEDTDASLIAIAPDKELCSSSEGHFLPLPDMDTEAASIDFINSVIDRKFGGRCKLNGLLLKGKITEKTFPQLRFGLQLLETRRNKRSIIGANTLWLDSLGGLISEAMKIGDFIAEHGMDAIVVFKGRCYSSCVFIYAAAKTRGGIGDVGIHRPFASEISAKSLSYSEYLKKYDALTPSLKQYFAKYGVSPALVDSMNVVSSDEIKILTDEERNSYGLGFNNVAATEHDKAITIQICGQAYYDMHIGFHTLIKSCRKKFGTSVLDDKDEECWALARQAYPSYSNRFYACKAKKANQ